MGGKGALSKPGGEAGAVRLRRAKRALKIKRMFLNADLLNGSHGSINDRFINQQKVLRSQKMISNTCNLIWTLKIPTVSQRCT